MGGEVSAFEWAQILTVAAVAAIVVTVARQSWWLTALAFGAALVASYRVIRSFSGMVASPGTDLDTLLILSTLVFTLPSLMWFWVQGVWIGVLTAAALHVLSRPGRPLGQAPALTLGLGLAACGLLATVPGLFSRFETRAPATECGTTSIDVQVAQTNLRLVPQLDLFLRSAGSEGFDPSHRYSTAFDARGAIADTCAALADAPQIVRVATGTFWRVAPEWEACRTDATPLHCAYAPPPTIDGIGSITLLDPAVADVSADARRQLSRYDAPNSTSEGETLTGGFACRTSQGTAQCLAWDRLPGGAYIEIETNPAATNADTQPNHLRDPVEADLLEQAQAAIAWVRATWLVAPNTP